MKNYFWLAVAGLCLVASPLRGSDLAPTSLPMGNSLLDWIVTTSSPLSVTILLQNINTAGGLNTCGMSADGISFSSYTDLQSYVSANSSRLFGFLGGQSTSAVCFRVNTTNSSGCISLIIDTDLGPTANITANSFRVVPTVQSVVLPVSGVISASAQFGTNSYTPLILATNGISIDNSFVTNNGRARISLTFGNGETVIYTQDGNPILLPTISMIWVPSPPPYPFLNDYGYEYTDWNKWDEWYDQWGRYFEQYFDWWYGYDYTGFDSYNLLINSSSGADTVVESTADFVSWTTIGEMSWNSGWTSTVIPISMTNYPMQFFRVKSY